jgi:type VI secretion system protein ImpH
VIMMRRRATESSLERLNKIPHRFEPVEALRQLDQLGQTNGRVRIRGSVTNRLVATPITGVRQLADGDTVVDAAFVGLIGPLGPLPPSYTETALLAGKRRSPSLAAFLDIFVHRLAALFVRGTEKYRLPAHVARDAASGATAGRDGIAAALFALVGLALPGLRGRLSFPDSELLPYVGLLSNRTRSAAGLEIMVADFLGLPVRVQPFCGRWLPVDPGEQTRLCTSSPQFARLGVDAIAGARLWDVQGTFRLVIGPLSYPDFLRLSPDGERMRRLVDATRLYAGPDLSFDVQLILARDAIPPCRLDGSNARLGWNTWAKLLPSIRDSGDTIYRPDI